MADCIQVVNGVKVRPSLRYQAPRRAVVSREALVPKAKPLPLEKKPQTSKDLTRRDWVIVGSPESAISAMRTDVATIIKIAAMISGFTTTEIRGPRRFYRLTKVRQVVMYMARKHTGLSLPAIGRLVGRKDHSTVLHAEKSIAKDYHKYSDFIREIEKHFPPVDCAYNGTKFPQGTDDGSILAA